MIDTVAYVPLSKESCTRNIESILNCKTQSALGWKYSLTIKSSKLAHFIAVQTLPTTRLLRSKTQ